MHRSSRITGEISRKLQFVFRFIWRQVKERAVELAKAIESEDGVDGAVRSFLKHLPQQRDSETMPTAQPSTFMRPLLLPLKRCFGIAS